MSELVQPLSAATTSRGHLARGVAALGDQWFHSIDLGDGLVTPGRKSAEALAREFAALRLPDVTGKSVLDIGAWDGYFAFRCEALGAGRVVALDHYVWSIDFPARYRYEQDSRRRGEKPAPWHEVPEVWKPESLPGRAGFDLAAVALNSKVEPVVADFQTVAAQDVGEFDVVLFLGVLYHLEDPVAALRKLAAVTREVAVIETVVIDVPGYSRYPLATFYPNDELDADPTNWWSHTPKALTDLCLAAGFRRVEHNPPSWRARVKRAAAPGRIRHRRGIARAYK